MIRQIVAVVSDSARVETQLVDSSRHNKMVNEAKAIHVEIIRKVYAATVMQSRYITVDH